MLEYVTNINKEKDLICLETDLNSGVTTTAMRKSDIKY